jgi:hypothetical protein
VHQAITDKIVSIPYEPPEGKDRLAVGYCADEPIVAYLEPVGVGDDLNPVPLYLAPELYVWLPLQATYNATWAMTPEPIRETLEVTP